MDIKTFIRKFILHYFLIYGLSFMATLIFCAIADRSVTFGLDYLWRVALFTLAADAPLAVFISEGDVEGKQYVIRVAIHGALLEIVTMLVGYAVGMWSGAVMGVIFFFIVLAVDAVMYALNYLSAKTVVNKINKRLKMLRESGAFGEKAAADGENPAEQALGGATDAKTSGGEKALQTEADNNTDKESL